MRSLGYALGGAAAARLASRHGLSTSGDSVLRQLRRDGCAEPATSPVVVGIDDWAIKRGHRYGIVIVDLRSRRPIKVLEGYTGRSLPLGVNNTQPSRAWPATALGRFRKQPAQPVHALSRLPTAGTS